MKKKSLLAIGLCVVLTLALASAAVWANDTTYDPASTTIEQTRPFNQSFDLKITSPTQLAKNSTLPSTSNPLITDILITSTSAPDGVLKAAAESLISANPTFLTFTALGQQQKVTITADVSAATVPGPYAYNIVSQRRVVGQDTVQGWGNGAATLTVVVSAPTTEADTTPPSVTISKPTADQSFTFCTGGTPVDIAFNAQDAESVISAVSADVNANAVALSITGLNTNSVDATGTYTANSIGAYTVNAHATSEGGPGDASANFSVNYNLSWLPPLSLGKTNKGGSTVPIKFTARDCNGAFVHDGSVKVVVYEVTAGGDLEALTGFFGQGAAYVRIDDVAGQYIINFQTSSGTHNYRADVFFNDFAGNPFKQGSKTFSVR
jgi:hypothetical protein